MRRDQSQSECPAYLRDRFGSRFAEAGHSPQPPIRSVVLVPCFDQCVGKTALKTMLPPRHAQRVGIHGVPARAKEAATASRCWRQHLSRAFHSPTHSAKQHYALGLRRRAFMAGLWACSHNQAPIRRRSDFDGRWLKQSSGVESHWRQFEVALLGHAGPSFWK